MHEVQWMLCFSLAILVKSIQQQRQQQRGQRQQQQVRGIQPAEQLRSALGLPAGFDCSRYPRVSDDEDSQVVLLKALCNQWKAAQLKVIFQGVQATPVSAANLPCNAAKAAPNAEPASESRQQQQQQELQQQQRQEQQQQQESSNSSLGTYAARGLYITTPPQLVQPLVLTLVQLCKQQQATLKLMECILRALLILLVGCVTTAAHMSESGLARMQNPEHITADLKAAAAEACSSYKAVLGDLSEPLLCQLGPAVLKAVRQVEKPPSSSKSRSLQPGRPRDAEAVKVADSVMSNFGDLVVLQYLPIREHLANARHTLHAHSYGICKMPFAVAEQQTT
jgi:hypothetical protein